MGHLLTGTSATVGLSLLSVGLAARALGPDGYGILALVLTLGQATERLVSFQSWQPIIRYGAMLDPQADRDRLRALYKFGLLLDLAGSMAGWLVASSLALLSHWLFHVGWDRVGIALLFLLSMPFNFNGTATAVFRLTDHFRTSAFLQVANALLRLVGSVIVFWWGGGLLAFTILWAATQFAGALLNIAVAFRLLQRRGLTRFARADTRGLVAEHPDLWKFTWGANASLTIWSSAQQLDTLIVGWLADPASAGLFHLAKRVSRVVQQVGSQVEAVVYPDLSRLWACEQRRAFLRLVWQTEAILVAFGACCVVGAAACGRWALVLAAGERFAGAAPLLVTQILAVAMTISGAGSRAALLAMGQQRAVLLTVLAAAGSFYLSVAPLILSLGAIGANFAHVAFGLVWLGGLSLSLRSAYRASGSSAQGTLAEA